MKRLALGVAALSAGIVMAAQPAATALVSVDLSKEEGPVKLMNRRGTHPTERAFFRVSRELCLAACPAERLFPGGRRNWRDVAAGPPPCKCIGLACVR